MCVRTRPASIHGCITSHFHPVLGEVRTSCCIHLSIPSNLTCEPPRPRRVCLAGTVMDSEGCQVVGKCISCGLGRFLGGLRAPPSTGSIYCLPLVPSLAVPRRFRLWASQIRLRRKDPSRRTALLAVKCFFDRNIRQGFHGGGW